MKARPADWIAGIGGILLLVSMVLDWYGTDIGLSVNAWQAFSITDLLIFLAGIGGIATLVAQGTSSRPAPAVAVAVVSTAFSFLVLLLVVYRLINQPGDNDLVGIEPGAFVGLASLLAVFLGSGGSQRDEHPRASPATVPVQEMPVPPVGS
jgi:hypothetical protein